MENNFFDQMEEGHGTGVLCYMGAWNSNSLPNIVKRFKEFLDTFHPKCRWCGTDLSLGKIKFYEHPDGLPEILDKKRIREEIIKVIKPFIPKAEKILWIDQAEFYFLCYKHYLEKKDCAWTGSTTVDNFLETKKLAYDKLKEGVPCEDCLNEIRMKIDEILKDVPSIVLKRFWIYVECPKCKHQWSFVKLGFGSHE